MSTKEDEQEQQTLRFDPHVLFYTRYFYFFFSRVCITSKKFHFFLQPIQFHCAQYAQYIFSILRLDAQKQKKHKLRFY